MAYQTDTPLEDTAQVMPRPDTTTPGPVYDQVVAALESIYDPEFPLIDVYTMGLFYDIAVDEEAKVIAILMTFTTPACPAVDSIQENILSGLEQDLPEYRVTIDVTFEPPWSIAMIRDLDLQRMFD